MTRVRNANHGLWALGLVLALQSGCSWVNRPIVYEDARETAPLQVPKDLLAPAANPALQIPAVEGAAPSVDATPPTMGNNVAVSNASLPRATNTVLTSADDADSTWRRVGVAIDRSGCCQVLGKSEAELSYQVALNGAASKPGFFRRMFGARDNSAMTLKVAAAETGSQVSVVDADGGLRSDDAAMTVLGVVEARLR